MQKELSSHILFFDSGVGGLRVLKQMFPYLHEGLLAAESSEDSDVLARFPTISILYLADTSHFPYSNLTPIQMKERAKQLKQFCEGLRGPPLLSVYACNSLATHLGDDQLLPGTLHLKITPAIHEACELSKGKVLVLCTPVTASALSEQREQVVVMVARDLARLAEEMFFAGRGRLPADFKRDLLEILMKESSIDTILLSCTHYIYAKALIDQVVSSVERISGRGIEIIDSTDLQIKAHGQRIRSSLAALVDSDSHLAPQYEVICVSDYPEWKRQPIADFVTRHVGGSTQFESLKQWL